MIFGHKPRCKSHINKFLVKKSKNATPIRDKKWRAYRDSNEIAPSHKYSTRALLASRNWPHRRCARTLRVQYRYDAGRRFGVSAQLTFGGESEPLFGHAQADRWRRVTSDAKCCACCFDVCPSTAVCYAIRYGVCAAAAYCLRAWQIQTRGAHALFVLTPGIATSNIKHFAKFQC